MRMVKVAASAARKKPRRSGAKSWEEMGLSGRGSRTGKPTVQRRAAGIVSKSAGPQSADPAPRNVNYAKGSGPKRKPPPWGRRGLKLSRVGIGRGPAKSDSYK